MMIPECGAIITQVTMLGLKSDGDPTKMTLLEALVVDSIGVERFKGPRIPGKIAGGSMLELKVASEGAIAMTVTMACTERTASAHGDEVIDDTIEVGPPDVAPNSE